MCFGKENCETGDSSSCLFLQKYRKYLDDIDFETMITGIEKFATQYKLENNIKEEIIMVLMVHEAPTNLCSERGVLKDYFKSKGYELEEFQPMKNIKEGEFEF